MRHQQQQQQQQQYRLLQGDEIDALVASAKETIETFRDARNNSLTLGPISEDGQEAITCPVLGLNAVDDLGAWTRILKRNFPGVKFSEELNPNGTVRHYLVLKKYVLDAEGQGGGYMPIDNGGGGGGGPHKPSSDRAMLLVVLLVVLSAMLWARL